MDAHSVIKNVNGVLMYMHFNENDGYFWKSSIHGTCIFTKAEAMMFIKDYFGYDSGATTMSMQSVSAAGKVTQKVKPEDMDALLKKHHKALKKKARKKRNKAKESSQGPEINELPVAPDMPSE